MHKRLERQVKKIFGSVEESPKELLELFELISNTYSDNDQEYLLMERSLDISSKELTLVNSLLVKEKELIEEVVQERTKELSQEKSKLNKIAQNMSTGAILLNKKGEVLFVNSVASKIIDMKANAEKSLVLERLFEKFKNSKIKKCYDNRLIKKNITMPEVIVEGSIFEISFQELFGDTIGENIKGTFGHLIWIKDVTEEKLLERSKSELTAVASHQLRTPLTVTKGNTEMLLDEIFGKLNKEQREIVSQTKESNDGLINLVNKMLDASRVDNKELSYDIIKIDINKLIELAIKNLSSYAERNNIDINYVKQSGKIPLIFADEEKLYEVFQNLIENAIKYTSSTKLKKTVEVSLSYTPANVEIKISDFGIGIPKKDQENIFQRFFRAKNASKHITNGTGLGLYIAKSIIDNLKGKIWFESELGIGTTFFVNFPTI